jgi:uncharacterized Zn finger protein
MVCRRCSGLLVRETFDHLREETARLYPTTRCINCGHIEDSVILTNRLRSHVAKRSAPRGLDSKGRVLFMKTLSDEYGVI